MVCHLTSRLQTYHLDFALASQANQVDPSAKTHLSG